MASPWRTLLPQVSFEAVAPTAAESLEDPVASMREALREAGLLEQLAWACDADLPVTIVINDAHRFTETKLFLDALFAEVDAVFAKPENPAHPTFRVLVAGGSHIANKAERQRHEKHSLGAHDPRFAKVAWHDARDEGCHSPVGKLVLHKWMAEGGLFIACGSVEPHYFAGITGAHKTLTVGVMSLESLRANHVHAMSEAATGLRLRGNPVHEAVAAAVTELEASGARLLALDQVIVDGKIVGCYAGHPLQVLERVLPPVQQSFSHRVGAPVDLVIARVAPPLDRDFYQADKGIKNTECAVRDGGVLILEAACQKGVGIDHFVELLREAPTHAAAAAAVAERGYRLGDHKAVRLRALTDTRGVRVALVSQHVDASLGKVLGIRIFADRGAAAAWAADSLPPEARGVIVSDAGNLTLELSGNA